MKKIYFLAIPYFLLFIYTMFLIYEYKINPKKNKVYFYIEGYDPIHILKGHYLLFKIKYNEEDFPCSDENNICGCLTTKEKIEGYPISFINSVDECEYIKCQKKIQLICQNHRFIIPHHEYYISEILIEKVSTIPENSFIELKIDNKGKSNISAIYVFHNKKNLYN